MPRQRAAEPRYRRRVVLEMTPDESTLLDRLADRYGTIRGAVLAGLQTIDVDRTAALEQEVRGLSEKLKAAQQRGKSERDRAAADTAATSAQLAQAKHDLKAVQATAKDLRATLRDTRAKLSRERGDRRTAEDARQAAQELLVRNAFCAACDKVVADSEWAEQPWQGGFATYHKRHGFHDKSGLLGGSPSLLFWRARSSAQ